jgi:hypothetical protein
VVSSPIHPPDQGGLSFSPDELLARGVITQERHREIELHRAHRLRAARTDFAEWERNRELDITHTQRTYGEDSPGATDAERTLALARTARRRDEADAVRVLARSTTSSPVVASRPRRRGAGRPSGARRSSRSSGESSDSDGSSSDDDDAARLRGFLVYLIGFDWPQALIDSAYAFAADIEREVTS